MPAVTFSAFSLQMSLANEKAKPISNDLDRAAGRHSQNEIAKPIPGYQIEDMGTKRRWNSSSDWFSWRSWREILLWREPGAKTKKQSQFSAPATGLPANAQRGRGEHG